MTWEATMVLNGLAQTFLSGEGQSLAGAELHRHVGQMAQQAPNDAVMGAVKDALGTLGPQGFGQSVAQAAQSESQSQRQSLVDMLLGTVAQGGGSATNAASRFGFSQASSAGDLSGLAAHVAENHPQLLAQLLAGRLNAGESSGFLSLLGNPAAREIGMRLAQRVL